jgi:predicted lipoprotein with Yx(FWY)xxD motif
MRKRFWSWVLVMAVVFAAGGALAVAAVRNTPGRGATTVIKSREDQHVQAWIVVNSARYTLYIWAQGRSGHGSTHSDKNFAPLITRGRVVAARGSRVNGHKLGTRTLPNGERQVTYYGQPLYRYRGDREPGQANGEEKESGNGVWVLVQANGYGAVPVY